MTDTSRKRAIAVLSVGERPWFETLRPWLEAYADRVGAALLIAQHAEIPPTDQKRLAFYARRTLKLRANILKILYLRDALEQYDDVLLFDDSCFVAPSCPDIFSAAPPAPLAAVPQGDPPVFNMGVLRASRAAGEFLADFEQEYVRQGKPRTEADVINNSIRNGRIQCRALDPRFNRVGSQIDAEGLDAIEAWVYHLTSFLHGATRSKYAARLDRRFRRSANESAKPRWTRPRVRRPTQRP